MTINLMQNAILKFIYFPAVQHNFAFIIEKNIRVNFLGNGCTVYRASIYIIYLVQELYIFLNNLSHELLSFGFLIINCQLI